MADAFGSHVRASIPLYDLGHELACDLRSFFRRRGGNAYEIGCATGELLWCLAGSVPESRRVLWVGIDLEPAMVARARERCADRANVEVEVADARDHPFRASDFMVAFLTMHFVRRDERPALVRRLYEALTPGGALLLFEKVRSPDARLQDLVTALHTRFKRRQGLSAEEILNKVESLTGVIDPLTSEENASLLGAAGFTSMSSVLRYLCFEAVLAVK